LIAAGLGSSVIHAQTQAVLNGDACAKLDAADRELNAAYQQLLVKG
jgi:uncharacterized protein YecT (DUF1311 family)